MPPVKKKNLTARLVAKSGGPSDGLQNRSLFEDSDDENDNPKVSSKQSSLKRRRQTIHDSESEDDLQEKKKNKEAQQTKSKSSIPRKDGAIPRRKATEVKDSGPSLISPSMTAAAATPALTKAMEPSKSQESAKSKEAFKSKDPAKVKEPTKNKDIMKNREPAKNKQPHNSGSHQQDRGMNPGNKSPMASIPSGTQEGLTVRDSRQTLPQQEQAKEQVLVVISERERKVLDLLENVCHDFSNDGRFRLQLGQAIDFSGTFLREGKYDFFDLNNEGEIDIPPKIPIFPEDFPPGMKQWPLSWWGIVDPAVGERKDRGVISRQPAPAEDSLPQEANDSGPNKTDSNSSNLDRPDASDRVHPWADRPGGGAADNNGSTDGRRKDALPGWGRGDWRGGRGGRGGPGGPPYWGGPHPEDRHPDFHRHMHHQGDFYPDAPPPGRGRFPAGRGRPYGPQGPNAPYGPPGPQGRPGAQRGRR